MKKAPLFMIIMTAFLLVACEKDDIKITDNDGNVYQGVKIGNQIWMIENLRTTHYADGSAIPHVEDSIAWSDLDVDDRAYSWYDNSSLEMEVYGGLYTWAAAMNGVASSDANPSGVQGVCPDGWHLPSEAEWEELVLFLGGFSEAGSYLKEECCARWIADYSMASNSSGFTALPGGNRNIIGSFNSIGRNASFWAATDYAVSSAYRLDLTYVDGEVNISGSPKKVGRSVRCVKD